LTSSICKRQREILPGFARDLMNTPKIWHALFAHDLAGQYPKLMRRLISRRAAPISRNYRWFILVLNVMYRRRGPPFQTRPNKTANPWTVRRCCTWEVVNLAREISCRLTALIRSLRPISFEHSWSPNGHPKSPYEWRYRATCQGLRYQVRSRRSTNRLISCRIYGAILKTSLQQSTLWTMTSLF